MALFKSDTWQPTKTTRVTRHINTTCVVCHVSMTRVRCHVTVTCVRLHVSMTRVMPRGQPHQQTRQLPAWQTPSMKLTRQHVMTKATYIHRWMHHRCSYKDPCRTDSLLWRYICRHRLNAHLWRNYAFCHGSQSMTLIPWRTTFHHKFVTDEV